MTDRVPPVLLRCRIVAAVRQVTWRRIVYRLTGYNGSRPNVQAKGTALNGLYITVLWI